MLKLNFENSEDWGGKSVLAFSEGCLNKIANEYCTEVAIPHVLSSKE